MPALGETVHRLLERRRPGARPGLMGGEGETAGVRGGVWAGGGWKGEADRGLAAVRGLRELTAILVCTQMNKQAE